MATEGETRFDAAAALLTVPAVDSALAFILSAMVGHIFGYEAALAIDKLGLPLREAREVIEHVVERGATGDVALHRVRDGMALPAQHFLLLCKQVNMMAISKPPLQCELSIFYAQ